MVVYLYKEPFMKKINIGHFLHKERINLNLTQTDFVANTLSVSQYSRIENGEQDIKSEDLFNILWNNNININDFFTKISENNVSKYELRQVILEELAQAFYSKDIEKAREVEKQISKLDNNTALQLRATLIISILENKITSLSPQFKQDLSDELNKSDNWAHDKVFLQLFGSSMLIFSMERLNIYMKKLISVYQRNISEQSFIVQRRIAGICINYLNKCYQEKNYIYVNDTLQLLSSLSENPDLLMYKLLGLYFESLFTSNEQKQEEILHLLRQTGYKEFIQNLPKTKN